MPCQRRVLKLVLAVVASVIAMGMAGAADPAVQIERLLDAPIVTPQTHPSIGENIQGPSLIRVPEWVDNPLGKYYLYFADHKGSYIRLAYADEITGPWHIHPPGSLHLPESCFLTEPPDVNDDELVTIERYMDA